MIVVVGIGARDQYEKLRDLFHQDGMDAPTWAELIEHAAVEDGEVPILAYPTHTAFVAPSRARELTS
jgi:hypothetical protein